MQADQTQKSPQQAYRDRLKAGVERARDLEAAMRLVIGAGSWEQARAVAEAALNPPKEEQ